MSNLAYRPEIDGLRTLAVLPVVLFHAGWSLFSGGFVGVDVFFVISGYLITSIILREQSQGTFTIASFYERRIRRILPALGVVLLVCLPFAWAWMLPHQLKDFSSALMAVPLFASNILFWRQTGYFDDTAEFNPLLHTWTLAVEEQFYIFFPLFLMLCWGLGAKRLTWLLLISACISLVIAEWAVQRYAVATFFLAPSRAWELLLGALCAFALFYRPKALKFTLFHQQCGSLVGLCSLIFAVFYYTETTPFPSLYTLVPTAGTALLILCATPATWVGRLLAWRPLVALGLISYSLYLWHQPIFAFARLRWHEPEALTMAGLVVLSALAAYLTWRWVEQPCRSRQFGTRKQVFIFASIGSALFIGLGIFGVTTHGAAYRLSPREQAILAYTDYPRAPLYRESTCFMMPEQSAKDYALTTCAATPPENTRTTVLWGDSHAASIQHSLQNRLQPDHWWQLTMSACPPILAWDYPKNPKCRANNDLIKQQLARLNPAHSHLYLMAHWQTYQDVPQFTARLHNTFTYLQQQGFTVTVLGGVPQWRPSLPISLVKAEKFNVIAPDDHGYLRLAPSWNHRLETADLVVAHAAQKANIPFISLRNRSCTPQGCVAARLDATGTPHLFAWDYGHLTQAGGDYLATALPTSEAP